MSQYNKTELSSNFGPYGNTSELAIEEYNRFFGPLPFQNSFNAMERQSITNEVLADAYKGNNMVLRDRIVGLILGPENQEFYTAYALPWFFTKIQKFQLDKIEFDVRPAGSVPYEGISRLLTSSRSSASTVTNRKGVAFLLEAGFYETQKGKDTYKRNCIGIARSVQETHNYESMYAILTCKNYERAWRQSFDTIPLSFMNVLREEILNYASISHDNGTRFRIAKERCVNLLAKRGAKADLMIVTPESKAFLDDIEGIVMKFQPIKPDGSYGLPVDGPKSSTVFGGIPVFLAKDISLETSQPKIQLLTRPNQVGEFYRMTLDDNCDSNYGYNSCKRDLYLYNQNTDYYEKVKFSTAFENSLIFDQNGQFLSSVEEYIRDANINPDTWKKPNASGRFDRDRMGASQNKASKPFLFATKNESDNWVKTHYIINMDKWTLNNYPKQLGECLVGKTWEGYVEGAQPAKVSWLDRSSWEDLTDLIQCIEDQPYDANFFRLLIEANQRQSVDANNAFVGEFTPTSGKESWAHVTSQREWKPNCFGGLDLPVKTVTIKHIVYPPGFSSWPCMLTLAAEADNPDTTWGIAANRAKCVVNLVKKFVKVLLMYCPFSEALKPENRAPWFHKPDPCTTFWENVVSFCRDPVWLAHLPTSVGSSKGTASKADNLDSVEDKTNEYDDHIKVNVTQLDDFIRDGNWNVNFVQKEKISMQVLPDYAKAFLLMGTYSYPLFRNMYLALGADRDLLVSFVLSYARDHNTNEGILRLRNIIIKLSRPGFAPTLVNFLKNLNKPQDRNKTLAKIIKKDDPPLPDPDLPITQSHPLVKALFDPIKVSSSERVQEEKLFEDISRMWSIEFKDVPLTIDALYTLRLGVEGTDELRKLVADYLDTSSVVNSRAAIKRFLEKRSESSGDFIVNSDNVSKYYRSPLVMNLRLLESTLQEEVPLIRPSDPTTGHNDFFVKGRGNVEHIWKRPNFIKVGQHLHNTDKPHYGLGFMQKHLSAPKKDRTPKSFASAPTQKRTRSIFADSESESDDEQPNLGSHPSFASHTNFGIDITKSTLRKTSHLDDEEVELRRPFQEGHGAIFDEFNTTSFSVNFKDIMAIPDPFTRAAALVGMLCPVNGQTFNFWIENNVHVPFNLLLWRLFIEHNMSSCVIMKSGSETGINIYGNTNFALGFDTLSKLVYGNFTFEGKSWVIEPKNIEILENVKPDGYVGGRNCVFIREADFDHSQEKYRQRPSLISTIIPLTETKFDFALSFTGPLPIPELNLGIDGQNGDTYSTAPYYEKFIWKLSDRSPSNYRLDAHYLQRGNLLNTVATQGLQVGYNSSEHIFNSVTEATGHLSKNASGPGAAAVLDGHALSFPVQDRSSLKLQ